MSLKNIACIALFLIGTSAMAQNRDYSQFFKDCNVSGSTTIYDYKLKQWIFSDSADAYKTSLPASTFKIINLLIALETGTIKTENDTVRWPGSTDTLKYGYRPDIYHDMSVKEAFQVSAGWVFVELAKRIGRDKYKYYLKKCNYGNNQLNEKDADFWNFGSFGISPINQVVFLKSVYEGKVPFSKRNISILKEVMITEKTAQYTIRSKTGWTRPDGYDMGWWTGYLETSGNVYFYATRIWKERVTVNNNFSKCRLQITKSILKEIHAIE
ncbi:class D beta-lactamase [Chitinophaga silvatica]|uniref:beta-lactamase n=1 Tax=Chitinophaga silvatica TaxID=2282649 RepID=A0A3E1Y4G8_9BACT|nr:penicillin-binding transpeptidase domain-containing protein [Chitinophaga silvatica]RFS19588.1 class D beta-lactamase [Chitinophaga silvatica]